MQYFINQNMESEISFSPVTKTKINVPKYIKRFVNFLFDQKF